MAFKGFPRGTRYTPVPDPLFGPLLEGIQDLAELKCILRAIWLLHHRKGHRPFLYLDQLLSDPVLLSGLKGEGPRPGEAIRRGLEQAVRRGSLLSAQVGPAEGPERVFLLNTEANRRALPSLAGRSADASNGGLSGGSVGQALPQRPSLFALYEENIGILTPLLAEELREAEETYPASWIEEALRLAVEANRRSWRYISRILERWATEGKDDGEPGRHSQKDDRQRYLKEYVRRRGPLPG